MRKTSVLLDTLNNYVQCLRSGEEWQPAPGSRLPPTRSPPAGPPGMPQIEPTWLLGLMTGGGGCIGPRLADKILAADPRLPDTAIDELLAAAVKRLEFMW